MSVTTGHPPTGFSEGKVYSAEIIDQHLAESASGKPQVVLTAVTTGVLRGERVGAAGHDPCDRAEIEILITIEPEDPNRLAWAVRDLEAAGFEGDDILRLHPDHPDCIRLVGRVVHARSKLVGGATYWNIVRPSKAITLDALAATARGLSEKVAAARRRPAAADQKGSGGNHPPASRPEPKSGGGAA